MPQSNYEIEVDLSMAEAWEKLRDFSAAIHYVPGLTDATITTEQHQGVGASRRVSQGKITITETIIEWNEGQGFILKLHKGDKGPMPFLKKAWYVYGLAERDGKVYLANAIGYEPAMGILGKALIGMGIGKLLAQSMRDSTIAQKIYYETDETVTPQMLKAEKAKLGE